MYGTILPKTGTILFITLQYGLRLAEFSINLPPKNPQIAPFGAVSRRRIGLYYPKLKRTPVFNPKSMFFSDGHRREFRGWESCLTLQGGDYNKPQS
jgi:hypothetical protein